MDDIVRQAMAKWPHVPACYGWLGLDARGQWWLRDAEAQACGGFASGRAGARGTLLRHDVVSYQWILIAFFVGSAIGVLIAAALVVRQTGGPPVDAARRTSVARQFTVVDDD